MAEIITVADGDTINKILHDKRSVGINEAYRWTDMVRKLNPHISDLNRIFPGERILLAANLNECVSPTQVWQNVFSHIPAALSHPYHGPITIYPVQPGDAIDTIADNMFAGSRYHFMHRSAKRAVLFHNNPILVQHLFSQTLPGKMVLDVTPVKLLQMDQQFWTTEQTAIANHLDQFDFKLLDFYENSGPEQMITLTEIVAQLKGYGASVGMDDMVKTAGYATGGVSGYAASASQALGHANHLARELYEEVVSKFGRSVATSKNTTHLAKMERFLKAHPKYQELMRNLKELPKTLLPQAKSMPAASAHATNGIARHFRKTYIIPYDKWNSSRYFSSAARQLNGKLGFFNSLGKHATWYIPATLGLINVTNAPDNLRMRTLFEEGFSIVGGFLGTELGGLAAAKLVAFCGLSIGPWGMFVLVAFSAGAVGWGIMELFKRTGVEIYDYGSQLGNGQTFYSIDQLLERF